MSPSDRSPVKTSSPRPVVLKPVLGTPNHSIFCMSPSFNTPDSTHQLISRVCKTWNGCGLWERHTKCVVAGGPQDRFENYWPRRPSGQDHGNQMSPLHNLTFLQHGTNCWFVWPEENWPPTESGFSQGFFLHSVTDGVLVPCRCRLWLA